MKPKERSREFREDVGSDVIPMNLIHFLQLFSRLNIYQPSVEVWRSPSCHEHLETTENPLLMTFQTLAYVRHLIFLNY